MFLHPVLRQTAQIKKAEPKSWLALNFRWLLVRCFQRASHAAKRGVKLAAGHSKGSDDSDRHESRNQGVLNRSGTRLVPQKLGQNLHRLLLEPFHYGACAERSRILLTDRFDNRRLFEQTECRLRHV